MSVRSTGHLLQLLVLLCATSLRQGGPQSASSARIESAPQQASAGTASASNVEAKRALWLSFFDAHVIPPASACEHAHDRSVARSEPYILVVGGMQNVEDYQGLEPLPEEDDLVFAEKYLQPNYYTNERL